MSGPSVFPENIVPPGLDFSELGLETTVRLGDSVVLPMTQTGKAVYPSENTAHLNGDNIMARAGLFARVEQGGQVHAGDEVELLKAVPRDRLQAVVITVSTKSGQACVIAIFWFAINANTHAGAECPIFRDPFWFFTPLIRNAYIWSTHLIRRWIFSTIFMKHYRDKKSRTLIAIPGLYRQNDRRTKTLV